MPDQIQRVRRRVEYILSELSSRPNALAEAALIRDGQYCGHRFSTEDHDAVWFFEENEIKVYDADHHLLKVELFNDQRDQQPRRAA